MTSVIGGVSALDASDRDESCSPVLRRGLLSTESGTLTQRFRNDVRVLPYIVETPETSLYPQIQKIVSC